MNEIMERITELLRFYRDANKYRDDEDIAQNEKNDLEEKAKLARDTFQAMFQGRLKSEKFLIDESEESVLQILRSWVEIHINISAIGGREVRTTSSDCAVLLRQLTSKQLSDREPAIWPYVRSIKLV